MSPVDSPHSFNVSHSMHKLLLSFPPKIQKTLGTLRIARPSALQPFSRFWGAQMVHRALFVVGACVQSLAHNWNASLDLSHSKKSYSSSIAIPASDELEDQHEIALEEYGFSLKLQRDMSALTANFKVYEAHVDAQGASVLWDAPPACLYRGFAVDAAGTALGAVVCTLCNGRLHAGIHYFDSIHHFGELKSIQNGTEMIDIEDMRTLEFDDIAMERSDFSLESASSRRLMADTRRILLADECDLRPNKTIKILNILDGSRLALFDTQDEAFEESLFIFMWVRDLYFYEPPSDVEALGIPADQIGLFKPPILNCRIVPFYDGILALPPQQFSWENPNLSAQTQLLQFTIFILSNPSIVSLNGEAVDNVQVCLCLHARCPLFLCSELACLAALFRNQQPLDSHCARHSLDRCRLRPLQSQHDLHIKSSFFWC